MIVRLKPNTEITVPKSIRKKAGIKPGDRFDFKVFGGVISIIPKLQADDEYTPAERRAIDRGIAESEKEYKEGRSYGPFETARELIANLNKESAKRRAKRNTRRVVK